MKKKIKIFIVLLLFIICTGCTDEDLIETYKEYDDKLQVSMDDLPECSSFTPNKLKYKSLWESIFIKPLAFIILKLGYLIKNMGVSVMIIGLLIRLTI